MEGIVARQMIEALGSGQPVAGAEGSHVLSKSYTTAIKPITKAVARSCGIQPSRVREVYWITGKPGNGKTQTLRQVASYLPCLEVAGKYAYVFIDFDKHPSARREQGLVPVIVRGALAAGQINKVGEVTDRILSSTPAEDAVRDTIVFGVDVFSAITHLPPSSLLVGAGLKRFFRYFRGQEWYIKKQLMKHLPTNPQMLNLLSSWIQYIIKPTAQCGEAFSRQLSSLSASGNLFDLFCYLLQAAKYQTLVLAFDEVNEVALENLKPLWDPPERQFYDLKHDINLIMLVSAKTEVWDKTLSNEALARRFCRTPNGHFSLQGPSILESPPDDLSHVEKIVQDLLGDAPNLARTDSNPTPESDSLRTKLWNKVRGGQSVTWQELWQCVIKVFVGS